MLQSKPSLYFTIEDIDKIKKKLENTWLCELYENLLCQADGFLKPEKEAWRFIEPSGRIPAISARTLEFKVGILAIAGYIENDIKYFDMARKILKSYLDDNIHKVFIEKCDHLIAGDEGRALSICYDFLYPYLNDDEKQRLEAAIVEVATYLYEFKSTWGREHSGVRSCNHNAVHYGGLGLCAIVLGNHDEWLDRAVERVRDFFEFSTDETSYITEGVSYGNYGLLGACTFADAYYRQSGVSLINEFEKTKSIPYQFIYHSLPNYKELIPYNDNSNYLCNGAGIMYLISKFQNGEALYFYQKYLGKDGENTYGGGIKDYYGDGISLPLILIWADENLEPVSHEKLKLPLTKHFVSGRVFARDKWDDINATLVSFRAGVDFHRGHSHNDQCSFTYYSKGENFLIDTGWSYNLTESHNTILINGLGQNCASRGHIDFCEYNKDYVSIIGDSTEAYLWEELLVGYAKRHFLFVKGENPFVVIFDDLQTEPDKIEEYSFMLHTTIKNKFEILSNNSLSITGSEFGSRCLVKFLNPDELDFNITDFGDRIIKRYIGTFKYDGFVNEMSVKTKARNPYFVTVIASAYKDEDFPEISAVKENDDMEITVKFSNNDIKKVNLKDGLLELIK